MKLHTYLNYGGNCAGAFHFYEAHLVDHHQPPQCLSRLSFRAVRQRG
jgi:hypothetical protein